MDGIGRIAPPSERREHSWPRTANSAAFGGVQVLGVASRGRLGAREQALEAPTLVACLRKLLTKALSLVAEVDDLASGCREVALGFRRGVDGGQSPLEQHRQSVSLLLDGSQAPQLS